MACLLTAKKSQATMQKADIKIFVQIGHNIERDQ